MTYRQGAGGLAGQQASYELWDSDSGNLIAEFDSEAEALAAIRRAALEHGPAALEGLSLLRCGGGSSTVIARGPRLASLSA